MARERASTRSATAEMLADAVQDADLATRSQLACTSARQHMHLGGLGGTPRGVGAGDASKCLPTSKTTSSPGCPRFSLRSSPSRTADASGLLPGGDGDGGR